MEECAVLSILPRGAVAVDLNLSTTMRVNGSRTLSAEAKGILEA